MKKNFTPQEIKDNKGCYTLEQVNNLSFIKQENINILDILNSEISIKDKRWFLYNKCNLTLKEKIDLSTKLAWIVLPIYENKFPNNKSIRLCLEGIELFNNDKITKEELLVLRDAAANAVAYGAADAYAAGAVAVAADAADAAAYATDAAYAADVAYDTVYQKQFIETIITFINTIKED